MAARGPQNGLRAWKVVFFYPNAPSMRNGDDGGEKKNRGGVNKGGENGEKRENNGENRGH